MTNKPIAQQIIEMCKIDQDVRKQAKPGRNPINFLIYAVDWVHNYRIRKLIERYGFPTQKMIGKRALHYFWLLIQHQDFDIELQKDCLDKCEFDRTDAAHLTDRVLIRQEKKQIYGTQFHRNKNGKLIPRPIQNRKQVNTVRKRIGLGTIEDTIKQMNKGYQKVLNRKKSDFEK